MSLGNPARRTAQGDNRTVRFVEGRNFQEESTADRRSGAHWSAGPGNLVWGFELVTTMVTSFARVLEYRT